MKYLFVGTVGIAAAYVALTWFFFGSPHPCGILEARQRPHLIAKARAESREDRRLALDLIKSMNADAMDAGKSILENLDDQRNRVTTALQRKIALMTPAECAWQAITWSPPKLAGRFVFEEQPAETPRVRPLRPDEEVLPFDVPPPPAPGGTEK